MKLLVRRLLSQFRASKFDIAPNATATEFEVNNWAISDFVLSRLVHVVGVHPYPLNELMLMAGAVCRFKPTHVFEWGTNIGASARVFYEAGEYFKIPLEIHSIDLPGEIGHVEHPGNNRGKLVRNKPGVTLHLGDGIETSMGIYRTLPIGSRVLFFVDGDHSYGSVKRELEAILAHVVEPKVLLHDTFYQSANSGYNIGPNTAVRDVLKGLAPDKRLKVIETRTGLPGMTLVY